MSAGHSGRREAKRADAFEAALNPVLEGLPAPVMLLGDFGEIVFANAAMRARFAQGGASRTLKIEAPEYAAALEGCDAVLQTVEATRVVCGVSRRETLHLARSPLGTCVMVTDSAGVPALEPANPQTTRLASLGFMVAGVCHEVANPLSAIHSMVQILRSRHGVTPETLEKGLTNIAANLARVLAITRRLSSFSRVPHEQCVPISLDAIVEEAAALLRHNPLGATVIVDYRGAPGAVVHARSGQLLQVISNIVLNAAQAMHGTGTVSAVTEIRADGMIELAIRDTGPGIPGDHLERVFEPFFSTKTDAEGTGLGLAISYVIVHELGGELRASNNPEGGACFTIELPPCREIQP
ncbi:MAG: ATP-binding protein [Burkholderiales bacterium]